MWHPRRQPWTATIVQNHIVIWHAHTAFAGRGIRWRNATLMIADIKARCIFIMVHLHTSKPALLNSPATHARNMRSQWSAWLPTMHRSHLNCPWIGTCARAEVLTVRSCCHAACRQHGTQTRRACSIHLRYCHAGSWPLFGAETLPHNGHAGAHRCRSAYSLSPSFHFFQVMPADASHSSACRQHVHGLAHEEAVM